MKKQRSASPSQAIPRSAPSRATLSMMNCRFSGSSGLGSWSGKSPSGVQYVSTRSSAEPLEQRADHRAGHAVAAVDDDLQRLDRSRVDELAARRAGTPRRCRPPRPSRRPGGSPSPVLDHRGGCPGCRESPDSAIAPRSTSFAPVYACGLCEAVHIRPPSRLARADEEVEHLGADLADVEHVRALGDHALAVARGELGRGEAHVAAEADAQLGGGLAGEVGDDARERAADRLGDVAVDLLAVEAADVVGLEDPRRCLNGSHRDLILWAGCAPYAGPHEGSPGTCPAPGARPGSAPRAAGRSGPGRARRRGRHRHHRPGRALHDDGGGTPCRR